MEWWVQPPNSNKMWASTVREPATILKAMAGTLQQYSTKPSGQRIIHYAAMDEESDSSLQQSITSTFQGDRFNYRSHGPAAGQIIAQ